MKLLAAVSLPLFFTAACLTFGCQKQAAPVAVAPSKPVVSPEQTPTPQPDPSERWASLLTESQQALESENWGQVDKLLAELNVAKDQLNDEQQAQLAEQAEQRADIRREMADQARIAQLAEAEKLFAEDKLDESRQILAAVLAAGPTDEQRAQAGSMKTKIEDQWKARRKLATAMRLLNSTNRGEIRGAQEQLWSDAEAAIPLLLEASRGDNPVMVANSLEMLRIFNQPDKALPAMLAVLTNPAQQPSWPAAIRELQKLNQPGAGEPLLKLAVDSPSPEQRTAALTALAAVSDPPQSTLVALLPLIAKDGPELAAVLTAARHGAIAHRQADLRGRRGFAMPLSAEQEQQLAALPQRLAALSDAAAANKPLSSEAQAALALAVATRQIAPQPLTGLKVARFSREEPTSPAAAVLDGVWNETAPEKLWRYSLPGPASIVLDLGQERTVAAVRIWNYNEASAAHRGWKEIEIFVSNSPALLNPVAEGLAPAAPGAAAQHDYSITLPVPFVQGRYVKLQPKTLWREDGFSGLTEIQVLGF